MAGEGPLVFLLLVSVSFYSFFVCLEFAEIEWTFPISNPESLLFKHHHNVCSHPSHYYWSLLSFLWWQGYFQLLFSCIEKLLSFLNVESIVLPAAEEAEPLWINKFGFKKIQPDQVTHYSCQRIWFCPIISRFSTYYECPSMHKSVGLKTL